MADGIPGGRRHTAVGRILHRRQVAVQVIDLADEVIKSDGFSALLQRLRQFDNRRKMVGNRLFRRLICRRRRAVLPRTEQRL